MSAFVKKLVEKASSRKPGVLSEALKPEDVNLRLIFHYGIPSGSLLLAHDSIQQILAISTKDGRIKLFGKESSQALLESPDTVPSKFLLFVENQGTLINVNSKNQIQVWDVSRKCLSAVHQCDKEITSCVAMQHAPYLYVGDAVGDISLLRFDQERQYIGQMKYHIPFSVARGEKNATGSGVAVKCILPQPNAETKRVLIIYSNGNIVLWGIRESKVICSSVDTILQSLYHETKNVTAACWACACGTKVVIGYGNGDIVLWSVPYPSDSKTDQECLNESCDGQISPVYKLNLGYKADRIPISNFKWADRDGKSSRLYVLGQSDNISSSLLQVVLLNESTESRTIKLSLLLPESMSDLMIISSNVDQKRCGFLFLLAKSSNAYIYDDFMIERYLAQCQNKSSPSLPKEVAIKLPYGDSRITIAQLITSIPCMPCSDEEFKMAAKNILPLFPFEGRLKNGSSTNLVHFKAKNLFITGHDVGTIQFWDASSPLLLQIASITQQSEDDFSVSGIPLTALHFKYESLVLVSGDQSGMVRIYTLKSEPFAPQSSFLSLQGSSKKGSNHIVRRIKLAKVNGSVLSININENLKHLAVGSDKGYVSLIELEGLTVLYQKHIASEFSKGIISTHFETCSFHGFEKKVLIVATKDSSILTLECDSGNAQNSTMVHPKKPSRALYTKILFGRGISDGNISDSTVTKQKFILLCSERAAYVYSFSHLVQGAKKVLHKKKFNASCYWASTFGSYNDGLVLLFTSGKIEIRSLPELSLLKENLISGLTFSTLKSPSTSDTLVSSSQDGELIIVNVNQELFFVSTLLHKAYRFLDSVSQIIDDDLVNGHESIGISAPSVKEKKRGIFGSMVKGNKCTKLMSHETGIEDFRRSIEELSTIFSVANFHTEIKSEKKDAVKEEDVELDIDDINIEDPKDQTKGHSVIPGLSRQNITDKFHAIKGRLKHAKVKNEKTPLSDEPQDARTGAVDHIKKKYGYSSSDDTNIVANIARTKLGENLRKLQEISMKTTEMQDTARSFSSIAKEVLRRTENEKKGS